MDDLMKTPMVPAANSVLLRDLLKLHNVPVYLESKTTEIKDGSITILTGGKSVDIPCDTVVVSVGYSAGTPLADGTEASQDCPHSRRRGSRCEPEERHLVSK